MLLVDEETRWLRRPRDLVSAVITLLAIVGVMVVTVYGSSTALAVIRDVRTATSGIITSILFMPVNALEGLIGFFLPAALVIDMAWHRRWRTLATGALAVASAAAFTYGLLWLFSRYFPLSPITGQLSDSLVEQTYFKLIPYVAVVSAILTVAGSGKRAKTTRWGWPLLSLVLVLSVLQGNQTLPGALITALLGVLCGLMWRYIAGDVPDRATGADLVKLVRRAGVDAQLVVRIDKLPDDAALAAWLAPAYGDLGHIDRYGIDQIHRILQKAGESFEGAPPKPKGSEAASPESEQQADDPQGANGSRRADGPQRADDRLESKGNRQAPEPAPTIGSISRSAKAASQHLRPADDVDPIALRNELLASYHPPLSEEASRNYIVVDSSGNPHHASFFDADQQIVGVLQSSWQRLVLTTTARQAEKTIDGAMDRFALMELASASAGLAPDRGLAVAGSDSSKVVILEVDGSTALSEVEPNEIPDEALDDVWDILQDAHRRGFSHGDVRAGVTALKGGRAQLLHWENGRLAASEMERRIDMAQAMAMMAGTVGVERAIASASRCLPRDQIVSLAPILQKAIVPSETMAKFTEKKQLERLRDRLTEQVPEVAEVTPTQLYRFSVKTVVTVSLGLVAVYILVVSVNFNELRSTLANANPLWMLFAFVAGLFTYIGAAMTLRAYTSEPLNAKDAVMVQVAASLVTLVAPAGIGPAALNLRFLQKRRVSTPVAVATVTLVQLAQFVTTIILLIGISLATGKIGSLSMPSGAVMVAIAIGVLAVAALFLVKPLRRWAAKKIRPTIDQVWPRLVWLATHPSRIAYGFAGSTVQTIAFVACFGGSLAAFGYSLPIVTLALAYLLSNSLGSVVPSPGGIGPVETALTTGLTVAGVPTSIAVSTAVLYRLLTFWGRVPLGWLALRTITKRGVI